MTHGMLQLRDQVVAAGDAISAHARRCDHAAPVRAVVAGNSLYLRGSKPGGLRADLPLHGTQAFYIPAPYGRTVGAAGGNTAPQLALREIDDVLAKPAAHGPADAHAGHEAL